MSTFLERLRADAAIKNRKTRRPIFTLEFVYDPATNSVYAYENNGQVPMHSEVKELIEAWQRFYQNTNPETLAEENREQSRYYNTNWLWSHLSTGTGRSRTPQDGLVWLERQMGDEGLYKIRWTSKYTARSESHKLPHTPHTVIIHVVEANDVNWAGSTYFPMIFGDLKVSVKEAPDETTWYHLTEEGIRWFKSIDNIDFNTARELMVPYDFGSYEARRKNTEQEIEM